ncbi:MAG: 6-carboxytetrahydropterin synthase [Alphaproteobacteria bacterium]|nr:6-carboxytetrahydropterin synthase [Alphaproteobacteria bacterium]
MPRTATIDLFKESMKFSAGHFTIFSATERENLHGHNFTLRVRITGVVDDNGMLFDYRATKRRLIALCAAWNETLLLPERSPHLRLDTSDPAEVRARFGDELLRFLPRDVTLLPVVNVTLEELSRLIGERLAVDPEVGGDPTILAMVVEVASGPGQRIAWRWSRAGEGP